MTTMQAHTIDPIAREDWQGIETFLSPDSPLIGTTVSDVEQTYQVHVHHIHNCPVASETQRVAKPEFRLQGGMSIHVWGTWDALDRLLEGIES